MARVAGSERLLGTGWSPMGRQRGTWAVLSGAMGANPDVHVRLVHGRSDDVIPVDDSAGSAAALEDAGYDVELVLVEGGHSELPDTASR